jgi:hypothetical protein
MRFYTKSRGACGGIEVPRAMGKTLGASVSDSLRQL